MQRTQPGVEHAVAVTVAPGGAFGAVLIARRANHAFHVGVHQQLQHRFRHGSQKITLTGLLQKLG